MFGGITIIASFQIHITKNHINRNKHILCIERAIGGCDITEIGKVILIRLAIRLGKFTACILLQIRSQTSYYTCHIKFIILSIVNLGNLGQRFSTEWDFAIDTSQLHISPSTDGLHTNIFAHGNILGTVTQRRITMGDIVVAVIDDTIINVCRIITVCRSSRKIS